MRIPNVNKTYTAFEGQPPPPSNQLPLINFYIGEDVIITAPLFVEAEPVSTDRWDVVATFSESSFASTPVWIGKLNEGVYHEPAQPSIYRIIIPSKVVETLAPGTYWLDISLKEPISASNDIIDKSILASRIPIGLNYSGASIKPGNPSPPAFNITRV